MYSFSKYLNFFLMLLFNTVCCHFLLEMTALNDSREQSPEDRNMSFPDQCTERQFDLQPPIKCHMNQLKWSYLNLQSWDHNLLFLGSVTLTLQKKTFTHVLIHTNFIIANGGRHDPVLALLTCRYCIELSLYKKPNFRKVKPEWSWNEEQLYWNQWPNEKWQVLAEFWLSAAGHIVPSQNDVLGNYLTSQLWWSFHGQHCKT